MTETSQEDERLWEEALDLIIRMQGDPDSVMVANLVLAWRARSPDHEAVWQEALEIHGMTGHILVGQRQTTRRRKLTRRALLATGTLGLGSAMAGLALGPRLIMQSQADFMTATAEIASTPLDDGSVVTLGPKSAIRLDYSPASRNIELLSGMAFFDVAADPERPFQVTSGTTSAVALGTAFDLVMEQGITTISVDHGLVEVRVETLHGDAGQLAAGQWMSLDSAGGTVRQGLREAGQIALWRDNFLIVERERVEAIVAQINRWQPGTIVIADPGLGALEISGVFDLRDPLHAVEAVVHPHGGKVRQISPWVTVVSKI